MEPNLDYLHIGVGLVALFFGRNLFWLLIALAGFLFGAQLVPLWFPDLSPATVFIAGAAAGLVGALLAILAERVAFGLAGFYAGALLALHAVESFALAGPEPAIALGGGVVGAVLAVLLTDWAIIVLACLVGASLIVTALGLYDSVRLGVFAALVVLGVVVQRAFLLRARAAAGRKPD